MEPDRHIGLQPEDQLPRDLCLPLAGGEEVAVEVDAVRVGAAPARVAIGVQLVKEPEIRLRVRALEQPCHLEPFALVTVDAADDEDALSCTGDVHDLDRATAVGTSELLRRGHGDERCDDQGAQHHPLIVGKDRERNWLDTFETARIWRPPTVRTNTS